MQEQGGNEGPGRSPPLDRDGVAALFDRHFQPLVAYARRCGATETEACDVVQDVFTKLWKDRATTRIRVSVQALLYTMVRNRTLNELRRRRLRRGNATALDETERRLAASPEAKDPELQHRLYRWIDELPDRRREAFMLSRFHDLSHDEIATIMGLSKRTVDTHILLALRSLRTKYDRLRMEEEQT